MSRPVENQPLPNTDPATVQGFGQEWGHYQQDRQAFGPAERKKIFQDYFEIFPWNELKTSAEGTDVGSGSGRWAAVACQELAALGGTLHCVDASENALSVARKNLAQESSAKFHLASASQLPFQDRSLDFAYSLGVLHHVPDTEACLKEIRRVLKPGAPFLLYLYYAFDNRSALYRAVWKASDSVRWVISRLPFRLRLWVTRTIALFIYWPFARSAQLAETLGIESKGWILGYYRDKSLYVMRTDALDRFGTRLEKRFTKDQIQKMLLSAGFQANPKFKSGMPFWVVLSRA